jgi:hypothetical protein
MKLYKYKNYAEYVKCQKAAYNKKINNVWAKEENIKAISEYLKSRNHQIGLCHGVRQGHEVLWFRKYLECDVVGTDIGGRKEGLTIQHDFNQVAKAFLNMFDFIYSNSFDHAYDPEETFNIWCSQLKSGGLIILEYDRRQEHTGEISKGVNKTDPVSITFYELMSFIPIWNIKAKVIDVLEMPVVTQEWRKAMVIEVK